MTSSGHTTALPGSNEYHTNPKGHDMTAFENIRDALAKRALYNRTVRELESLPSDLAIEDLGIYPADARAIAKAAVYGD